MKIQLTSYIAPWFSNKGKVLAFHFPTNNIALLHVYILKNPEIFCGTAATDHDRTAILI